MEIQKTPKEGRARRSPQLLLGIPSRNAKGISVHWDSNRRDRLANNIDQEINFKASPHDVYETLMDSDRHTATTGATASISREVGGPIKAWGDYIVGENLELIADKKIVQKWRAADWPYDHYSTVTFELTASETGTDLHFSQIGVPEESVEDIAQGWIDSYWDPMKAAFDQ